MRKTAVRRASLFPRAGKILNADSNSQMARSRRREALAAARTATSPASLPRRSRLPRSPWGLFGLSEFFIEVSRFEGFSTRFASRVVVGVRMTDGFLRRHAHFRVGIRQQRLEHFHAFVRAIQRQRINRLAACRMVG